MPGSPRARLRLLATRLDVVCAAVLVAVVAGCAPVVTDNGSGAPPGSVRPPTSAAPTSAAAPGVRGRDWAAVDLVEAPKGNPDATLTPYEHPGSLGHGQRYQGGEADLLDVATSDRLLVAVGYLAKDITAAMWWSTDGHVWALAPEIDADEGSIANGVAIGARTAVAVGGSGADAAAWTSGDGRSWQRVESPAFHDSTQVRMTTVAASGDGFVAGGYVGTLVGPIRAAFWTSPDGASWTRVADAPGFADARVTGLARAVDGSGYTAVGVTGDAQHATGGAAWTSRDGVAWSRADGDTSLEGGVMNAVTATPDGFVAVGSDVASTRAIAWRSDDGKTWSQAPDATSLDNFGLRIEMRDVTWAGDTLLAGGHYLFGTQYPTGALWTSRDARTWVRAPDAVDLSQGKVQGVASRGDALYGVGSYGSPDFSIPTIWVSPPTRP